MVHTYLQENLRPDTRQQLHAHVAAYYGAPFMDEARRQVVSRSSTPWSAERIEWLARSDTGILGMWIRQTQDLGHARQCVERDLAWQYHLFEAGDTDAASQVVAAIIPILNRWGMRDLTKALLRRNVATLTGIDRAVALSKLANHLVEDNHLNEALAAYEVAHQIFATHGALEQMAQILKQIGKLYVQLGQYERAIEKNHAMLQIMREIKDNEGQAVSLQQLAQLYRQKGDYKQALTYNLTAEKLDRERGDLAKLSIDLYERGILLKLLGQPSNALQAQQDSLAIARRIGSEEQSASNLTEIAALQQAAGNFGATETALTEALEIYQQIGSAKIGSTLEALGALYEQQGAFALAREKYDQARAFYQKTQPANVPAAEEHLARVREKAKSASNR